MKGVIPARPPTQLFDWKRVCAAELVRPFPPIVGRGRGHELRKLDDRGLTQKPTST